MTRVLICGGRDADPYRVTNWLSDHLARRLVGQGLSPTVEIVIHGAARGADTGAHLFAMSEVFPNGSELAISANWDRYKLAAGPIRNRQLLLEGKPDAVIAFPGKTGTANMIKQAEAAGVPVIRVEGDFTA